MVPNISKAAGGLVDEWETSGFALLRGFPAFDNQRVKASNHLNLTLAPTEYAYYTSEAEFVTCNDYERI
jgi:hypothetical protein